MLRAKRRGHSHLGPHTPIHHESGLALGGAVMGQRIKETVRAGIAPDHGRAQDRRRRREEHEKIERFVTEQMVQQPPTDDFRVHYSRHSVGGLLEQRLVREDAGGVDDAADWRTLLSAP